MYSSTNRWALLLGDVETAVDVYEVLKAEFLTEAVRPAEGFGHECREVVDVLRLACTKERTEECSRVMAAECEPDVASPKKGQHRWP